MVALAAVMASCGSSSQRVKVYLTDAPLDGATAVNVTLTGVQLLTDTEQTAFGHEPTNGEQLQRQGDPKRITLMAEGRTINLLELRNGARMLLGEAEVEGTIEQIRLLMDGSVTVVFADGNERVARVPSGAQTGIKVIGPFDPAVGEIVLDFDAADSIHETGNGELIMRPTIKALVRDEVVAEGQVE